MDETILPNCPSADETGGDSSGEEAMACDDNILALLKAVDPEGLNKDFLNAPQTSGDILGSATEDKVVDYIPLSEVRELTKDESISQLDRNEKLILTMLRDCGYRKHALLEERREVEKELMNIENEYGLEESDDEYNNEEDGIDPNRANSTYTYELNKTLARFFSPYFTDLEGGHPKFNEETQLLTSRDHVNPTKHVNPKPWTAKELQKLKQVVSDTMRSKKIYSIMEISSKNPEEHIDETQAQMRKIKEEKLDSFIPPLEESDKIEWLDVAMLMKDRTADECEIMWRARAHPSINTSDWERKEEMALLRIAAQHNFSDWDTIAKNLATGRTAFMCFEHYQSKLNTDVHKAGRLTPEETQAIEKLIDCVKIGNYIPWHQVHLFLNGRSLPQIKEHHRKKNLIYRGKRFTALEDEVIYAGNLRFPNQWRVIAQYLPGRDGKQIRERYVLRLENDARVLGGEWSAEEDQRLCEMAKKENFSWVAVAKHFTNRSYKQVAIRYKKLEEEKNNPETSRRTLRVHKRTTWVKAEKSVKELKDRFKDANNIQLEQFLNEAKLKLMHNMEENSISKAKSLQILKSQERQKRRESKKNSKDIPTTVDEQLIAMFSRDYVDMPPPKPVKPQKDIEALSEQCAVDVLTKHFLSQLQDSDSQISQDNSSMLMKWIEAELVKSTKSTLILPPNGTTFDALGRFTKLIRSCDTPNNEQLPLSDSILKDLETNKHFKLLQRFVMSAFLMPAVMNQDFAAPPKLTFTEKKKKCSSWKKRHNWLVTGQCNTARMKNIRALTTSLINDHLESISRQSNELLAEETSQEQEDQAEDSELLEPPAKRRRITRVRD